jgi:HK97 family phage prohead protease
MKINKNINISISSKNFNISESQDEITLEGYASKMFDNGKEVVDLDSEFVDTKQFELIAKRLLLNHKLEDVVGEIELEHRPDGIYLKGKAYKDTMDSKEWARLRKGLYSFSIGFTVEDGEYREINGQETLTFTKGIVYEVSLVPIASNPKAIIDNMKSINMDKGCIGLQCSVDQIKSMNPNMPCDCLEDLKKEAEKTKGKEMDKETKEALTKSIQENIIKGLTIEETMSEIWNVDDNLWQMFRYFIQTIEDNIYEFEWSDSYDRTEMVTNINSAMELFKQTLEEESLRIGETIGKEINQEVITKGKDMKDKQKETKSTETETPSEEVTQETPKEVETKDSETDSQEEVSSKETQEQPSETSEKPTEKPNEEPKEDLAKTSEEQPSTPSETTEVEPKAEPTKEEPKEVQETKVDEPKVVQEKPSIFEFDLVKAEPEEIAEAYDKLADRLEEIERYVEAELAKDTE